MVDWTKIMEQLAVVTSAPIPFAIALLVVGGLLWLAINWSFRSVLAAKNGQIELLDRQIADYKSKLHGATPDEAKARIDALEARLKSIEPRRLRGDARQRFVELISLPTDASYRIAITCEASGDSMQFGADFASAFRTARWQISEASVMGIGNRPSRGLALLVKNLASPPREAQIVMLALQATGIAFDLGPKVNSRDGFDLELFICMALSR